MDDIDPTFVDGIETDDSDPYSPLNARFAGVAYHGNTPFDTTVISHIEGNLYTGGHHSNLLLPSHIENVVSMYRWGRWKTVEDLKTFLEVEMFDALDENFDYIDAIAEWAAERVENGPTLIHCQAGLNRSSLVAAVTLQKLGHPIEEAIALLRERRSPAVLCNSAFEEWLKETYK